MTKRIGKLIGERWRLLRRIYGRVPRLVLGIWTLVGAYDLSGSQFASARVQKDLRLGNHIPHISALGWVAIGLALLLVLGLDGAAREIQRVEDDREAELRRRQDEFDERLQTERAAQAVDHAAHEGTIAALERERTQPVSGEHQNAMIEVARRLSSVILSGRACQYFGRNLRGQDAKEMLAGHFPDQISALDRWDSATAARDVAAADLIARASAEIGDGMSAPPWHAEGISGAFAQYLERYCRTVGSGAPDPEPNLSIKDGCGFWTEPYMGSQNVNFTIFDSRASDGDAAQYENEFRKRLQQVRTSPEFDHLRTALQTVHDLKFPALDAVQGIVARAQIYGRCKLCDRP